MILHTPGNGEVLNLHWDPVVLLQAGNVKMHQSKRGEHRVLVLVWRIPSPVHLLTHDSAACPGHHVWYELLGQVSKVSKAVNLSLLKAGWVHSVSH